MSHNKNKQYITCKECKRKRYCSKIIIPDYNFRWTCSKGHSWIEIGITASRLALIMKEQLLPKIKNLFERNNAFFAALKNK